MILPSVKDLKKFYAKGEVATLAKWLPHLRNEKDPFISFLMKSNLLTMKEHISDSPVTLGADPEFILCKKGKPDEIVLFSSQWLPEYFGVSEAEVGADYGLLEFRPEPEKKPKELIRNIKDLHATFKKDYGKTGVEILEKEAVEFNHKKARIREVIVAQKDINYGMHRGKDVGVWVPAAGDVAGQELVLGQETGMNLSAYDRPSFPQFNDELFTAGGHIHIGGAYIMMLSLQQLRAFVRKLDKEVLPICESVETKAGKLRRTVYGSSGEFRMKAYGIEYRSPSNAIFWKKNLKMLKIILDKIVSILKTMATS